MIPFELFPRRRIRLVRQSQMAECGIACVAMVAGYYGLDVDLVTFRRRFVPSIRGITLRGLMQLSERVALVPRAVRVDLEELAHLRLPAILHWDMNHFVVLEKVKGGRALIHDPAGRSYWLRMADVGAHFSGVALELTPSLDFTPGRFRSRLSLGQLWSKISGVRDAALQVIALSLVLQAFILISPYYLQSVVDIALPTSNRQLVLITAAGFGLFAVINATATLLRSAVLLSAGTSISFGLATNISRHIFRLPIGWFDRRQTGDVLARFQSIEPIQRWLTRNAPEALIDGSLVVLTVALMALYSTTLTLVAMAAVALYGVGRLATFRHERSAREAVMIATGKEQTSLIESLKGMTTLRVVGGETIRHAVWQSRLTDALNADVRLARVGIIQTTLNVFIFGLESVLSVALAADMIIAGESFTLGMLFAFTAYKFQFVTKSINLADQIAGFNMLALHFDRLADIVLTLPDENLGASREPERPFAGGIELKRLGFRYSDGEPWIFRGVDLAIAPGEHVAITGPSGVGKSTLLKVMLGLLPAEEGEVLVDGRPILEFGYDNFRAALGTVLQEDTLFTGSLAENISFFDEQSDRERVIAAAQLASIHDSIMAMPMRYETPVGDMGSALSGGQKQRVLLARALYRRPTLLVMDEGTAFLDRGQEQAVNRAVSDLGITRVIVAHRRETIEAADRVVVLTPDGVVAHEPSA